MRWNKKILVYLLTFCMVVYQTMPGMSTIAAEDLFREADYLFGNEDDEDPAIAEEEIKGTDQSYTTEYSDLEEEASEGDVIYDSLDELSDEDPFWDELIEDISETLVGLEPQRMELPKRDEITEVITERAEEREETEEAEDREQIEEAQVEQAEAAKAYGAQTEAAETNAAEESETEAAEAEGSANRATEALAAQPVAADIAQNVEKIEKAPVFIKPATERVNLADRKEVLTEQIVETLVGLDAEMVTEAESEIEIETEIETEVQTVTEVETEVQTETETETETEVQTETKTEIETETQTETETETETEVQTETETETETEAQTEIETEVQTETETETETEAQTETETETETEAQTETETGVQTETEAQTEPQTEITTEADTEDTTEVETEELTEVETEEAAEAETEELTEVKTEEATEAETEELTEAETEEAAYAETEELTEAETEEATEVQTEELTETETEELTEAETEDITEAETEDLTEAETEDLTEAETEDLEDLTEGETEELTEAETEGITEEEVRELTTYTYEDADILVEAELEYPEAIPDDAQLTATRVTAGMDGYNYEAYMDALNQAFGFSGEDLLVDEEETEAEQKPTPQFTSENTILYDIAFLTQNLDPETGEPDGTMKEYEPEIGSVSIRITFLKNQLKKELGAETAEDLQVVHLPLTQEVRESVPTTMDATQITADDILVEEVDAATDTNSLDSLNMELNSLSVTAVISGSYDPVRPSTATKTVTDKPGISIDQIINGVGASGQFGIVANYFYLANHMASTIAVKELDLSANSGQFGLEYNNPTQSRIYPGSYKISVNKKVEGENKVGNFTFGLFKKNWNGYEKLDSLTLQTNADGEGAGIFIGDFDNVNDLYVFELDAQGNILQDQTQFTSGITSYTVDYEKDPNNPVVKKSDDTKGSNINYVEKFKGNRTNAQVVNHNETDKPVVIVGTDNTVYKETDGKVVVAGNGATVHFLLTEDEVTVQKAQGSFPFDFTSAMSDLRQLSKKLAESGSSDDVDVYDIEASSQGLKYDLSMYLYKDENTLTNGNSTGISLADGRFLVINIDCSNLGSNTVYQANQYKVNGTLTSGDLDNSFASRIIFNYYTKDADGNVKPYTGKISIDESSGIHILPRGTVTEFKNLRGSIFADKILCNQGEIHHDPIIHASVNGSANITNTYKGTLQHIDMPETGSKGQLLCMLAGLMMIAAGGMLLTGRKKRYQIKENS